MIEHVGQFLAQCGEAACEEALRVRFFPLSLSGSAFTWLASLPQGSISGWADLEKKLHKYFFVGIHEMRLTDLTLLRQRNNESFSDFIHRLRDVRSRYYGISLTDGQMKELAFLHMRTSSRGMGHKNIDFRHKNSRVWDTLSKEFLHENQF